MAQDDTLYEPDRVEGCPHPRHTARLFGQDKAERAFLDANAGGRAHHGWLLTGPRGIGKATLAWRIATFLLAAPPPGEPALFAAAPAPGSLDVAPDHPVRARIAALSDPALFLMRPTRNPETGTPRRQITVDVSRGLRSFLQLSASAGGARAVIVDAADDMNAQAANAILKLLEEPPARTTFLLVSHAPARLLPTIRSRCRTLPLGPLDAAPMARALDQAGLDPGDQAAPLAELSGGSVGEAARLLQEDGPALYAALIGIARDMPGADRAGLLKLSATLGGAANSGRLDAMVRLIGLFLSRLARTGAGHPPLSEACPGEAEVLARLASDAAAARRWAALHQEVTARIATGRAVNLDPAGLVLDAGLRIDAAAGGAS